jgi:hypothetical protein
VPVSPCTLIRPLPAPARRLRARSRVPPPGPSPLYPITPSCTPLTDGTFLLLFASGSTFNDCGNRYFKGSGDWRVDIFEFKRFE